MKFLKWLIENDNQEISTAIVIVVGIALWILILIDIIKYYGN
jgi:hypothetical protein